MILGRSQKCLKDIKRPLKGDNKPKVEERNKGTPASRFVMWMVHVDRFVLWWSPSLTETVCTLLTIYLSIPVFVTHFQSNTSARSHNKLFHHLMWRKKIRVVKGGAYLSIYWFWCLYILFIAMFWFQLAICKCHCLGLVSPWVTFLYVGLHQNFEKHSKK